MSGTADAPPPPNKTAGTRILVATMIVAAFAVVTTLGRTYVRLFVTRGFGYDDAIMFVTMLMVVVNQVLVVIFVKHNGGRHMVYIPPQDISIALHMNFITQPIAVAAITMAKFSIGLFLLRLTVERFYRRLIIGTIVFTWAYTLWAIFSICLQCTNIAALWDITVKAKCLPTYILRAFSYTNSVLCIVTDLMFAVLIPLPMLWKVQMNWRDKSKVLAILSMSLGLLATSASVVKLSYVATYGKNQDWLWDTQHLAIWTTVECCVGIVAGNLPTLRQFLVHVLGAKIFTFGLLRTFQRNKSSSEQASHGTDTIASGGQKRHKQPGESDLELVTQDLTTQDEDVTREPSLRDEEAMGLADPSKTKITVTKTVGTT